MASDPERLRRFEREARATSAISHPNVIVVYDVGSTNGRAYVVLTNLRAVREDESTVGWTIEAGPLPGWEEVPTW